MKLPQQKIEMATCDVESRYALKAVYLDAETKTLIATDGHILAVIPAECEPTDASGLIPVRAFKVAREALKRIKPKLRPSAMPIIRSLRKIIIRASYHGEDTVLQRPQGVFPKVESVFPCAKGAPDIIFDIELLNRLVLALQHPSDRKASIVRLWINKSKQPTEGSILISVGEHTESPGVGVLMPMRADGMTAETVLASTRLKNKPVKTSEPKEATA